MPEDDDKEWLKGTPFSKWIKRLEELEKKLDQIPSLIKRKDERIERLENNLGNTKFIQKSYIELDWDIHLKYIEELKTKSEGYLSMATDMTEGYKELAEQINNNNSSIGINRKEIKDLRKLTSNIDGPIKSDSLRSHILNMKVFNTEIDIRIRKNTEVLRGLIIFQRERKQLKFTYNDIVNQYREFEDKLGGEKTEGSTLKHASIGISTDSKPPRLAGSARQTDYSDGEEYIHRTVQEEWDRDQAIAKHWQDRINNLKKEKEPTDDFGIDNIETFCIKCGFKNTIYMRNNKCIMVEKADIRDLNELNYLYFKEKYLPEDTK